MDNSKITKLSGLKIKPKSEDEKKFTGLYAPQLTQNEIDQIDASVVENGGLVYDTTNNQLKLRKNNAWVAVTNA